MGLSRRCSNAEDHAKLDCRSLSALARADTSCTLSTWQGLPMHKLGAPLAARRCPPPSSNNGLTHASRVMQAPGPRSIVCLPSDRLPAVGSMFCLPFDRLPAVHSNVCQSWKDVGCCWAQQSWLLQFEVSLLLAPCRIQGPGPCGPSPCNYCHGASHSRTEMSS